MDANYLNVSSPSRFQRKRIAIIGGGWSGLYALKATRADGHDALLFEKDNAIGGVWRYDPERPGGVWRSVYAVTSKTYLHASDFPMPDDYPLFPHNTQILTFMESYVAHFGLRPYICLNHTVEKLEKKDDMWLATIKRPGGRAALKFDAIIICVGQAQVPAYPTEPMYGRFTGATMHSHEYKYPTEAMRGKNILVIGGGESASDITNEISGTANKVYMSLRRGQWFMDRHNGARLPLDIRFSRKARSFIGDYGGNFLGMAIFNAITGLIFGQGGHGVEEWLPTVSVMRGFVNKSRDVLQKIVTGQALPRKGVRAIEGKQVWFEDCKEAAEIDMIIYATGFQSQDSFLPQVEPNKAYKFVFNPVDPSLAYVGTVRPVFGSVPALAELQARWVSAVFSGRCSLPSESKMVKTIEKDRLRHQKLFPADHDRLPNLVSHFEYADYIMEQLGALPNFWKLFFTNNKRWRALMSAPWTAFEALLTDPEQGETAYQNVYKVYIEKKSMKRHSLFKFMLFLFVLGLLSLIALLALTFRLLILPIA